VTVHLVCETWHEEHPDVLYTEVLEVCSNAERAEARRVALQKEFDNELKVFGYEVDPE